MILIERQIATHRRARLLPPGFKVFYALIVRAVIFIVGDVIDKAHVSVQREHGRSLGLGKQPQTVIKVPCRRARDLSTILK